MQVGALNLNSALFSKHTRQFHEPILHLFFQSQNEQAIPLITDKDITGFAPVHYAAKHGHLQVQTIIY